MPFIVSLEGRLLRPYIPAALYVLSLSARRRSVTYARAPTAFKPYDHKIHREETSKKKKDKKRWKFISFDYTDLPKSYFS